MLEVTYLIWSEKDAPAELDALMWMGADRDFGRQHVSLSDEHPTFRQTVMVAEEQHRNIDFVVYSLTEDRIIHVQVRIGEEVADHKVAAGDDRLVSLDTRWFQPD